MEKRHFHLLVIIVLSMTLVLLGQSRQGCQIQTCQECSDWFVNTEGDAMTGDLTVGGRLGIGVDSPSESLEVGGNVKVAGEILPEGGIVTPNNITIKSAGSDILITAGNSTITVDPAGGITIDSGTADITLNSLGDLNLTGASVNITSVQDVTIQSGMSTNVDIGTNLNVAASSTVNLQAASSMNLAGSLITLNGAGQPAARAEDPVYVDPFSHAAYILTGSSSVFIGP